MNNREQFIYYLYLNYKPFSHIFERHSRYMTFYVKRIEIYMLKCLVLHFNRLVNCVRTYRRQYRTPHILFYHKQHRTHSPLTTLNIIFGYCCCCAVWLESFFMLWLFLNFSSRQSKPKFRVNMSVGWGVLFKSFVICRTKHTNERKQNQKLSVYWTNSKNK